MAAVTEKKLFVLLLGIFAAVLIYCLNYPFYPGHPTWYIAMFKVDNFATVYHQPHGPLSLFGFKWIYHIAEWMGHESPESWIRLYPYLTSSLWCVGLYLWTKQALGQTTAATAIILILTSFIGVNIFVSFGFNNTLTLPLTFLIFVLINAYIDRPGLKSLSAIMITTFAFALGYELVLFVVLAAGVTLLVELGVQRRWQGMAMIRPLVSYGVLTALTLLAAAGFYILWTWWAEPTLFDAAMAIRRHEYGGNMPNLVTVLAGLFLSADLSEDQRAVMTWIFYKFKSTILIVSPLFFLPFLLGISECRKQPVLRRLTLFYGSILGLMILVPNAHSARYYMCFVSYVAIVAAWWISRRITVKQTLLTVVSALPFALIYAITTLTQHSKWAFLAANGINGRFTPWQMGILYLLLMGLILGVLIVSRRKNTGFVKPMLVTILWLFVFIQFNFTATALLAKPYFTSFFKEVNHFLARYDWEGVAFLSGADMINLAVSKEKGMLFRKGEMYQHAFNHLSGRHQFTSTDIMYVMPNFPSAIFRDPLVVFATEDEFKSALKQAPVANAWIRYPNAFVFPFKSTAIHIYANRPLTERK